MSQALPQLRDLGIKKWFVALGGNSPTLHINTGGTGLGVHVMDVVFDTNGTNRWLCIDDSASTPRYMLLVFGSGSGGSGGVEFYDTVINDLMYVHSTPATFTTMLSGEIGETPYYNGSWEMQIVDDSYKGFFKISKLSDTTFEVIDGSGYSPSNAGGFVAGATTIQVANSGTLTKPSTSNANPYYYSIWASLEYDGAFTTYFTLCPYSTGFPGQIIEQTNGTYSILIGCIEYSTLVTGKVHQLYHGGFHHVVGRFTEV